MKRRTLLLLTLAFYSVFLLAGIKYQSPIEQAPLKEATRSNPYEGLERAEKAGQKLYRRECASCHGQEAQGTGRAPALVSPRLRRAAAGAIFWVLRNGSLRRGMPSFSHLPEPQRWQIITYLKTL
jgi:mono/diheme cytochrome c family protein